MDSGSSNKPPPMGLPSQPAPPPLSQDELSSQLDNKVQTLIAVYEQAKLEEESTKLHYKDCERNEEGRDGDKLLKECDSLVSQKVHDTEQLISKQDENSNKMENYRSKEMRELNQKIESLLKENEDHKSKILELQNRMLASEKEVKRLEGLSQSDFMGLKEKEMKYKSWLESYVTSVQELRRDFYSFKKEVKNGFDKIRSCYIKDINELNGKVKEMVEMRSEQSNLSLVQDIINPPPPLLHTFMPLTGRQIWKIETKDVPLVSIGPHYASGINDFSDFRYGYILKKSYGDDKEIQQLYISSLSNEFLSDIMGLYKDEKGRDVDMDVDEFRVLMVLDGSSMLLQALLSLGYECDLPQEHRKNEYLESFFFPGNQIPIKVLRKLLEQPFLQKIVRETNWDKPNDLMGKALYICLLQPQINFPLEENLYEEPVDLLHALHMLVLGQGYNQCSGIPEILGDSTFPTASELSTQGIRFKGVKGGIRGLKFKGDIRSGVLMMPMVTNDQNVDSVFHMLTKYESNFITENREVTSYLGLMKDLISTIPDTTVLAKKRVIRDDLILKNNFGVMVNAMNCKVSSEQIKFVKLQVKEYSKKNWGDVLVKILNFILLVLGAIGGAYVVVDYYKKNKSG